MAWTDEDRRKLYAATHNATKEREQRFADSNRQRAQAQATQRASESAAHDKRMRQIAENGRRMQSAMNSGGSSVRSSTAYQESGAPSKKKGGLGTLLVIVAVVVGIAMISGNDKPRTAAPSQSQPIDEPQPARYTAPREVAKPSPVLASAEEAQAPPVQATADIQSTRSPQDTVQPTTVPQTVSPAQVPEQTYAIQKTTVSYPKLASDYHIQGVVKLMLTIAPDGTVTAAESEGQASPILVDAAQKAVASWRYNPSASGVLRHKEETVNYFLR